MFHCVHFECPSMEETDINSQSSSKSPKRSREITELESAVQPTETATEAEEIPSAGLVDNLSE